MYEFIYYQVQDVMTPSPMTASPEMSIGEVEQIFENHDFNGLPVVEEDGLLLVGMVTKLDILKAFSFTGKTKVPPYDAIMARPVARYMTDECRSVRLDTPLTRVLQKMTETGHKSFPVLEASRVIGIISREDILRALRRAALGEPPARMMAGSSTVGGDCD